MARSSSSFLLNELLSAASAPTMTLLRQSLRIASRQAGIVSRTPLALQARQFGAVGTYKAPFLEKMDGDLVASSQKAIAGRPFQGASNSEPTMEYVEEPSMLYMT